MINPENSLLAAENAGALVLLLVAWTLPWKGVALWKAAQNKHKVWFIIILIVNTLALLEILYIFFFSRRNNSSAHNNKGDNTDHLKIPKS